MNRAAVVAVNKIFQHLKKKNEQEKDKNTKLNRKLNLLVILLGNSFLSRGWLGSPDLNGNMPIMLEEEPLAAADRKSSQKAGGTAAAVPKAGDQIEGSSTEINHNAPC